MNFDADIENYIRRYLTNRRIPVRVIEEVVSGWKECRDDLRRTNQNVTAGELAEKLTAIARSQPWSPSERIAAMTDRELLEAIYGKLCL